MDRLAGAREAVEMLDRLATAQVELRDFALISYAVPAERLRPHIPEELELETFAGPRGQDLSLISTSCFCNKDLHLTALPQIRVSFDQNTYRTYVTHRGRRGTYFFGSYVSTALSLAGQSALAHPVRLADYTLRIQRSPRGYELYSCRAVARDGTTEFELSATDAPEAKAPFDSSRQLVDYITYRVHGYARNPLGFVTYGPVSHRRLEPYAGRLAFARIDFWETHGILSRAEAQEPHSVLVEPSVRFVLRMPRIGR